MNLKARIAKLEAAVARREAEARKGVFDLDAEVDRWEGVLDEIERLLGGAAGLEAVVDHFDTESVNIHHAAREHGEGDAKATRWFEAIRRVPAATLALFERLPPDLRVAAASRDAITLGGGGSRWAGNWVHDLAWLTSRLPPGIGPDVMRSLATAYSGLRWGVTDFGAVCVACGLRRPAAESRAGCPHCREAEWWYPGQETEAADTWRVLALQELDPPAA
jgi:hypothetical protein